MPQAKSKRMSRVLKVLVCLRQAEEARLCNLQRKSLALRSSQSNSIAALNNQYEQEPQWSSGFANLFADQMRRHATQEHITEQQAEAHRERLTLRRGHERITENVVRELNRQVKKGDEEAELNTVIEAYGGKPAASNP